MTTRFYGEGNIGSDPECKTFPPVNGKPPKALIKLNIKFDNPVPDGQGGFKDQGGFWMPVDWWHTDAQNFSSVFAKGMRVIVSGRQMLEAWEKDGEKQSALKIVADRVAVLPFRIDNIVMEQKRTQSTQPNNHQKPPQSDNPQNNDIDFTDYPHN